MRASASGCVTGTGVAVAAGQVASFTLDGYAAPGKPDVYGPTVGGPGENLEWRVFGNDPNRDPVQFKFDFGDGTTSDWTEFIKDGSLYKSHIYENKGSYQLKVKSRDCDLMESDWTTKEITIKEPERPGDLRIFIVNLGGWTNLHPGETKYGGYFVVQNQGDLLLRWEISDWPDWGTWDFAPDYGDTHGGYGTTVHVIVTAPNVKKGVWTGEIKVVNKDNSDDFEILVVSMTTPKNKASNTPLFNILKNVLQNYPNLFPLLQQLFQRFFNL